MNIILPAWVLAVLKIHIIQMLDLDANGSQRFAPTALHLVYAKAVTANIIPARKRVLYKECIKFVK
jgi:hypothetical protein